MNEARLIYLFQAYLNKTATSAERDELMQLLERREHDELVKSLLTNTWQQYHSKAKPFDEVQGDAMLASIFEKAGASKQIVSEQKTLVEKQTATEEPVTIMPARKVAWWWRGAAAAVLLGVMSIAGYTWLHKKPAQSITANRQEASAPVMPGGNKAILTLADGAQIVLDSINKGALVQQGNAQVMNVHTAVLAYSTTHGTGRETIYNTLTTPRGGQYQLILADGTKVWLNASSSIQFPVTFTGKERNVSITGEAYFEVAKNAAMPFSISVKDATVQVLGTHFNIMAYDDERSINTTLLEGAVKVRRGADKIILAPGQMSKITPSGRMKVAEADVEEVMAWKNGSFHFSTYDTEQIMRQVARWYDVEVVYEGKIPEGHYSGIVNRDNNISQVLKIMQDGGVRFKLEGRKVIVLEDHP